MSAAFSEADPRTTTPVSDLSETGVYVHTDELPPIGTTIELRFTVFPEEPVLFEGRGSRRAPRRRSRRAWGSSSWNSPTLAAT